MPVSRVFTTDISRNKEILLKVFIEDDSNNFGSSSIGLSTLPQTARKLKHSSVRIANLLSALYRGTEYFSLARIFWTVCPTDSSATHIRGQWENLVCRNHAGSDKVLVTRNHAGSDSYRGGGLHRQKSRRQQQSPRSSGCFASGIPQGRHLQMPGRSWRAGQPSGDGKPAGPDVPP